MPLPFMGILAISAKNNHEPNQMPVPNPKTWGNIDQLKYEMEINKIDYATIVSAQIWNNTVIMNT